ncbi:MAG: putative lipid II flippase FtsW [Oscillospiraceae bacterium]
MAKKHKASSARMPHMDATFLIIVLALLTFGLIMLFSASYAYALYQYGSSFYFIQRQAVFAVAGVIGMLFVSCIDYHILQKFVFWAFAGGLALLVVVLFMPPLKGARRWINLGFATFQPSEIMKFALILLFAYLIAKNYDKMGTFRYGILPFMIPLAMVCGLMFLEPHISGIVLMVSIALVMMFVGGVKYRYYIGLLVLAAAGVLIIIMFGGIEYVEARLQSWLDPFSDPQGDTFQTVQSLLAIGSGGFTGLGLGNSRQKYLYLPEPQNDFIFSIVCEELGFLGAMALIILFAVFVVRGFIIASRAPDKFGSMLAVGLTAQIGIQAIVNIAVVTNTIPNTGISLPFFSYGGTALMMQLLQMGIVLNISRHSAIVKQ